jgi:hypothetical protein
MPSRFDIAMGKVVKEYKPKKIPATKALCKNIQVDNFVSHLKLRNAQNNEEISLVNADFSLSVSSSPTDPIAAISISFSCPVEQAQRLFQGVRK